MKPTISILALTNKTNEENGKILLQNEGRKVQFLNPKLVHYSNCNSYRDYNKIVACDLNKLIDTDFVLIVQNDGRIMNPATWTDEFFEYDYIGGSWKEPRNLQCISKYYTHDHLVGNGGFSLRSKKLQDLLHEKYSKYYRGENEDVFICQRWRHELEEDGIKFAPLKVADVFSIENNWYDGQFGVHNSFLLDGVWHNMKCGISEDKAEEFYKLTSSRPPKKIKR